MSSVKRLINFILLLQFLWGGLFTVIEHCFPKEGISDANKDYHEVVHQPLADLLLYDEPASYLYGDTKMLEFIYSELKWPKEAPCSFGGTTVLNFTIDQYGQASDYKILKSLHHSFDVEVIRVLKKIKLWSPAKKDGYPVASQFNLPIRIHLE